MFLDIEQRVLEEGNYIAETGATVRQTAKVYHYGKSTVHKDVAERLYYIDKDLHKRVQAVLKKNLEERHIRGGEATRKKYLGEGTRKLDKKS